MSLKSLKKYPMHGFQYAMYRNINVGISKTLRICKVPFKKISHSITTKFLIDIIL